MSKLVKIMRNNVKCAILDDGFLITYYSKHSRWNNNGMVSFCLNK
jgi:hypothetical protein